MNMKGGRVKLFQRVYIKSIAKRFYFTVAVIAVIQQPEQWIVIVDLCIFSNRLLWLIFYSVCSNEVFQ